MSSVTMAMMTSVTFETDSLGATIARSFEYHGSSGIAIVTPRLSAAALRVPCPVVEHEQAKNDGIEHEQTDAPAHRVRQSAAKFPDRPGRNRRHRAGHDHCSLIAGTRAAMSWRQEGRREGHSLPSYA